MEGRADLRLAEKEAHVSKVHACPLSNCTHFCVLVGKMLRPDRGDPRNTCSKFDKSGSSCNGCDRIRLPPSLALYHSAALPLEYGPAVGLVGRWTGVGTRQEAAIQGSILRRPCRVGGARFRPSKVRRPTAGGGA